MYKRLFKFAIFSTLLLVCLSTVSFTVDNYSITLTDDLINRTPLKITSGVLLNAPAELSPWSPPIQIHRLPENIYTTDFNVEKFYISTGKTYYIDIKKGNDKNIGSIKKPLKTIVAAFKKTDVAIVMVKGGIYDKVNGFDNKYPSKSISIIGVPGEKVIISNHASVVWSKVNGLKNTYKGTIESCFNVVDTAILVNQKQDYSTMTKKASISEVDDNAGSWYFAGKTIYVHTIDGRPADKNIRCYLACNNGRISSGRTLFAKNINFEGGLAGGFATIGNSSFYAKNCSFKYSGKAGVVGTNGASVYLQDSIAASCNGDGFNYSGCKAIEYNCVSRNNGKGASNRNSYTYNASKIIRLNSAYWKASGQNIMDSSLGTCAWNVGCISVESLSDIEWGMDDSCKSYIQGCICPLDIRKVEDITETDTINDVENVSSEPFKYVYKLEHLNNIRSDRVLAWNDEFNSSTLNNNIWDYELGYIRNNEIQWYTSDPKNVYLENSILHLKALKDNPHLGYEWSSGSILSRKGFAYGLGLLEARIKYDRQDGCWPAFWSKGNNNWKDFGSGKNIGMNWPECGEIDIVEFWPSNLIHPGAFWTIDDTLDQSHANTGYMDHKWDNEFHIYGLERTPNELRFYLDRELIGKIPRSIFQDELYTPHYVILNLALGGIGGKVNNTLTSTDFQVDWVRYYLPEESIKKILPSYMNLSCGKEFALNKGKRMIVHPIFNVDFAPNYSCIWSSSNESVATCYAGTIKTLSVGTTTITATSPFGLTASCNLTVSNSAVNLTDSIQLYSDSKIMEYGDSLKLRKVISPEYRTKSGVTWESSNTSIATVNNGVVTAVNPKGGNVTITCRSSDGNASAAIKIRCDPEIINDGIDSKSIIYKYTKSGWSNTTWTDDIGKGNVLNFDSVNMENSTKVLYTSGLGYKATEYSTLCKDRLAIGFIDLNSDFSIVSRIYLPSTNPISTGALFSIEALPDNNNALALLFNFTKTGFSITQNCRTVNGDAPYKKDNKISISSAKMSLVSGSLTQPIAFDYANVVYVHDYTNKTARVLVNGTEVAAYNMLTTIGKGVEVYTSVPLWGIKQLCLGAYGKLLDTTYYQALLVYSKVLSNEEIKALDISLNKLYE